MVSLMKKMLFVLLLAIGLAAAYTPQQAVIYKNEACGHCTAYISSLYKTLESAGIKQIEIKDFLGDPSIRTEVSSIQSKFEVPVEMQGHLVTLVDGKYLFEGHFPQELMKKFLLEDAQNYGKLVVTQDSMGQAESYFHLENGKVVECPINQPISECTKNGGKTGSNPVFDVLKVKMDSNLLVLGLLALVFAALLLLYSGVIK